VIFANFQRQIAVFVKAEVVIFFPLKKLYVISAKIAIFFSKNVSANLKKIKNIGPRLAHNWNALFFQLKVSIDSAPEGTRDKCNGFMALCDTRT
jgi:hypothetical protein